MSILDACEKVGEATPKETSLEQKPETNEDMTFLVLTYGNDQHEFFSLSQSVAKEAVEKIIKAIEEGEPKVVRIVSSEEEETAIILTQVPRTIRLKSLTEKKET